MKKSIGKLLLMSAAITILGYGLVWPGKGDKVTYQGNKARITVGEIKSKASECDGEMAASIGEMLSTALANDEKFIVLANQEEVQELKEEIDLGESDLVEEGKGAQKGLMEGADVLVTGAVTAFEPEAGGSGGALGGLKKKAFGKIGLNTKSAEIAIDLKLIDIRTRRVILATPIEAKSTNWGTDISGGGWVKDVALSGGLGTYSNKPMEKAIRAVLAKTVDKISKEVPEEYYRYKGKGEYSQQYGETGGTTAGAASQQGGQTGGQQAKTPEPQGGKAYEVPDKGIWANYDFVPGDRVLFFEDFSTTPTGDFPSHLIFGEGNMEVVEYAGKKFLRTDGSSDCYFDVALPEILPDRFTIEFEINPSYYTNIVPFKGKEEYKNEYSYLQFRDNASGVDGEGGGKATSAPQGESLRGKIFYARAMADGKYIKVYMNGTRVANVPNANFVRTNMLRFNIDGCGGCDNGMITNIRIAAGGKRILYDALMVSGRVATQGIYFDSGSDLIKPESKPTLDEIGKMLTDHQDLKIIIEGHTDSDGADDYNLDLSDRRAGSVKSYLIAKYGIDAGRLQSKGYGETKPVSPNTTSEGKANNRRVELVKI